MWMMLTRIGLSSRIAKWCVIVAMVVALALAVQWAWKSHNAGVAETAVALDRADMIAEAANRVIAADREANANAAQVEAKNHENEKELTNAVIGPDPVRSTLERMREQQAAGRR